MAGATEVVDRIVELAKARHKELGHPPTELHLDLESEWDLVDALGCYYLSGEGCMKLFLGGLRVFTAMWGMQVTFDAPELKVV